MVTGVESQYVASGSVWAPAYVPSKTTWCVDPMIRVKVVGIVASTVAGTPGVNGPLTNPRETLPKWTPRLCVDELPVGAIVATSCWLVMS